MRVYTSFKYKYSSIADKYNLLLLTPSSDKWGAIVDK